MLEDPKLLAARQLELDRARTAHFPDLFGRKVARMSASPLAFLRGAAPLFYELLARHPELALGPANEGWIVGDAHLENFGAFRPEKFSSVPEAGTASPRAVFDLNDFDEAVHGPWRWDVLRLTTSLVLGGRELGASGRTVLELSRLLLGAYVNVAFAHAPVPAAPPPVAALVTRVQTRSRKQKLEARTLGLGEARRFVRGDRYRELAPAVLAELPQAIERYRLALPEGGRPQADQLTLLDAAHRIAGTGSLGVLRIALLTRGKGGPDGAWTFDFKAEPAPSAAPLLGSLPTSQADAAVTACRASLRQPPRMLASVEVGGERLLARRLMPQEDKLDLTQLRAEELPGLAAHLGGLLGAAHARATPPTLPAWSSAELSELLERAVVLAGLHEAVYLAYCLANAK